MRRKLKFQLLFLLLLVVGTVYVIYSQRNAPYRKDSGSVFGTVYHIKYQSPENLHKEIMSVLENVDNSLSTFNEKSIISRINRGEPVEIDNMFHDVYQLAERVSNETNGAFDITVAPLVNAWGFGFKKDSLPDKRHVDSLLQIVGYEKVQNTIERGGEVISRADSRMMLDCGAIAKGYAVDAVARLLKKRNVKNFMIEIGGEIVVNGTSENNVPWKIGVARPVDDTDASSTDIQIVINVTDRAMATSGNYRNFYYKDGKKYAHIIDPRTGYPVNHNLLSVTVIAPDCATADAYATAFMVMGLHETQAFLKKHLELSVYMIYADKNGKLSTWSNIDELS